MTLRLCRICGNKEDLLDILEQGPTLLEKLAKCASIKIKANDILPKLICRQCDQMLDMSYQLRKQSETMQEKLQQELKKEERIVEVVHCISDDEGETETKKEIDEKEEKHTIIKSNVRLEEDSITVASAIRNLDEFTSIEPEDSIDMKTDSTIAASETEDINQQLDEIITKKDIEAKSNKSFRSDMADDLDSNYSFPLTTYNENQKKENAEEDELVDIGDMNEEDLMTGRDNTDIDAIDKTSLEVCSIDLLSNPVPQTAYDDAEYLNSHSISSFTCVTCNEVFFRKKDYQEHIKQHGSRRYECIQCLATFPTRYRLVRHEGTHSTDTPFHCSYCDRQYSVEYNLRRHIKTCHGRKETFPCNICQAIFARKDVLKRHILQKHTNKKWHCKTCGVSFRSNKVLDRHKSNTSCGTTTNYNPSSYIRTSLPPEYIVMNSDNRYKCVYCNALFKTMGNYKTHLRIHEDIRPFPCELCHKRFRTRYALITHQRIHNNERPFKCDNCFKSFRQITHLKQHLFQHKKDDMPYKCKKCQSGFITKWKLRDHMRRFCGEKIFKCAECPEEFFLKYDLKRHARSVHYRSVDIADTDDETNQGKSLEGTTETDRTDDERINVNQMHEKDDGIIDILDDDDDEERDDLFESSSSMEENIVVLNEADPPELDDDDDDGSSANLGEMPTDFNSIQGNKTEHTAFPKNFNTHTEDTSNDPTVHFINFVDNELTPDPLPKAFVSTNSDDKQFIIQFIDLEDETNALPPETQQTDRSVKENVSETINENGLDVINLDDDDDDDDNDDDDDDVDDDDDDDDEEGKKVDIGDLKPQSPEISNKFKYMPDDSKPIILSSMILKPADDVKPSIAPPAMEPENKNFIEFIHLDSSSDSCYSPPPQPFYGDYHESKVDEDSQEDAYDMITEEKIQITEERIETFSSFYSVGDMAPS